MMLDQHVGFVVGFGPDICLFFVCFVTGKNTDLDEYEPNILAGLIKLFIRELTDSILPEEIAQRFEEASGLLERSPLC